MHARGLQRKNLSRLCLNITHFDSCMREDCNGPPAVSVGTRPVLIHACAKIATDFLHNCNFAKWAVLIHACAKIATSSSGEKQLPCLSFDSCMREDCNGKYAQISVLISVYSYDFVAHMFYASVIYVWFMSFAWCLTRSI